MGLGFEFQVFFRACYICIRRLQSQDQVFRADGLDRFGASGFRVQAALKGFIEGPIRGYTEGVLYY